MPATWNNQAKTNQPSPAFLFKIDDDNYFLIDNTYKLIIQDGNPGIVWANQSKS